MKPYGQFRAFGVAVAMATLATMALGTDADEDRAERRDLDAMQGTWRMIPSEDVPPELLQFAKKMKVVFRGDRLTLRLGDQEQHITKISCDRQESPRRSMAAGSTVRTRRLLSREYTNLRITRSGFVGETRAQLTLPRKRGTRGTCGC
jgi:hypothetical protein